MEIVQKKLSNIHSFSFGNEKLSYSYEDKSGSADFDVHYGDIPNKSSVVIHSNEWLRNVGILFILLGVYYVSMALYSGGSAVKNLFDVALGSACIIFFYFTKVKYRVFKTDRGNIFVIEKKGSETIINEMMLRRKNQLLSWYGNINLENDIDKEIDKFKWLQDQNVLSEQEASTKIAEAQMLFNKENSGTSGLLN